MNSGSIPDAVSSSPSRPSLTSVAMDCFSWSTIRGVPAVCDWVTCSGLPQKVRGLRSVTDCVQGFDRCFRRSHCCRDKSSGETQGTEYDSLPVFLAATCQSTPSRHWFRGCADAARRGRAPYRPLDEAAVRRARERRLKEMQMWDIVREIVLYSMFLWILMVRPRFCTSLLQSKFF